MAVRIRTSVIGLGVVGKKRLAVLGEAGMEGIRVWDPTLPWLGPSAADAISQADAVIIATPHVDQAALVQAAVAAGRHVLVEKPCGVSSQAIRDILGSPSLPVVRVGYNHRFHPCIQEAYRRVTRGDLGPLRQVVGHYGHGGGLTGWRADPANGGEVLDQGSHLVDLALWFTGEPVAGGQILSHPDEASGTIAFRTQHTMVHLSVSAKEWRPQFRFDIYGEKGKIELRGLGGVYGIERGRFYPAERDGVQEGWSYVKGFDDSWRDELIEFAATIRGDKVPSPVGATLADAENVLAALGL